MHPGMRLTQMELLGIAADQTNQLSTALVPFCMMPDACTHLNKLLQVFCIQEHLIDFADLMSSMLCFSGKVTFF